jgi:hypothetical protein
MNAWNAVELRADVFEIRFQQCSSSTSNGRRNPRRLHARPANAVRWRRRKRCGWRVLRRFADACGVVSWRLECAWPEVNNTHQTRQARSTLAGAMQAAVMMQFGGEGRSLSDEETLRALTAIGRCLWERARRVVRWCLFRCCARIPKNDWRRSCRYQHAGRQPAAANQVCSTRAKMKQLENGARREAAGTLKIDTVCFSAAPRGAGVMPSNFARRRLFTCCLLVNTPAIPHPMWIVHNPQRWAPSLDARTPSITSRHHTYWQGTPIS